VKEKTILDLVVRVFDLKIPEALHATAVRVLSDPLREFMREVLGDSPRRKVLLHRFGLDAMRTIRELADELACSRGYIKQCEQAGCAALRVHAGYPKGVAFYTESYAAVLAVLLSLRTEHTTLSYVRLVTHLEIQHLAYLKERAEQYRSGLSQESHPSMLRLPVRLEDFCPERKLCTFLHAEGMHTPVAILRHTKRTFLLLPGAGEGSVKKLSDLFAAYGIEWS
jgi:hypothetical protein